MVRSSKLGLSKEIYIYTNVQKSSCLKCSCKTKDFFCWRKKNAQVLTKLKHIYFSNIFIEYVDFVCRVPEGTTLLSLSEKNA